MLFSDFVERAVKTPISCELKQDLDRLYEFYIKDHDICMFYIQSLRKRKSIKSDLPMLLPSLLEKYEKEVKNVTDA